MTRHEDWDNFRDERTVARYEAWFETPQGRFALGVERRLLERLISPWARRQQRLVEIGCGAGLFLHAFWEAGFDVTGLDASPAMLAAARKRLGNRADLHLGQAESLPFDDKEFDYAALITVLEFCEDPLAALREAVRVARKGVIVGFLNRHSLTYLTRGAPWPWRRSGMLAHARWLSRRQVHAMMTQAAGPRPSLCRSVLPGPPCTWRDAAPWRQLASFMLPVAVGAFAASRFDLVGEISTTPLMAWKIEPGTG